MILPVECGVDCLVAVFVGVLIARVPRAAGQSLPYVDVYNDFIRAHPYYENYRSIRPVDDAATQMNVSVAVALNHLVEVDESRQVLIYLHISLKFSLLK